MLTITKEQIEQIKELAKTDEFVALHDQISDLAQSDVVFIAMLKQLVLAHTLDARSLCGNSLTIGIAFGMFIQEKANKSANTDKTKVTLLN